MNAPDTDETLLTAYALGELDGPERARVAALVEADVSARLYVEEVRETAGLVTSALEGELADGLAQIEMGVIEQRLREQERDLPGRRFQPAGAKSKMGLGQTRWLPFAASLAASILIVCGALAVLLPRLDGQRVANNSGGNPVIIVRPHDGVERPGLPGDGGLALSPDDTSTNEELATNAAPGEDGELEWEPVEEMKDPGSVRAELEAQRRAVELAARDAAVPAPPGSTGKGTTPAPQKPAPDAARVARGPVRSPEAERVRPPTVSASPKARGPKSVNVSPPRDPRAFERIVKEAKKDDRPRLYENPFRDAKQRPRSSFPVRVETSSYRLVRSHLLEGKRPPAHLVRIEEMLNRFAYDADPAPAEGDPPVAASVEVKTCPWNVENRLARVAIRARDGGATVVARGVDVSIEFNPDAARAWRLIGYENGPLSAGQSSGFPTDLAAGGAATALYEIVPATPVTPRGWGPKDLFTLSVRYADPHERASGVIRVPATDAGEGFDRATPDFRFAASVAAFGMLLRDSQFKGTASYADVMRWAREGAGNDPTGERAAFIDLARAALELTR